jgi:aryl-alcohol dehydrogenase-like predicted oxidoreductase
MISSIGLGTYLGYLDDATDENYRRAIVRAVQLGSNVIDTAINYRFQRSERAIGKALHDLASAGTATRDEIMVATKAGYLTFDGGQPEDPREYFEDEYLRPGIVGPNDIVAESHCMTPRYLENQIDRSLRNLGVHTIDIFYVHNPETQLSEIAPADFYKRLRVAFGYLETAVRSGKINHYGVATWNAFRANPGAEDYVSLEAAVQCARDVAGEDHHFRFAQLPFNLAMPEAWNRVNQEVEGRATTMLEAARMLNVTVMASASLFQRRLSQGLPVVIRDHLPGLRTDSQRAIQFVRSTGGIAVSLVGMSRVEHVQENLEVAAVPPVPEAIFQLFDAP